MTARTATAQPRVTVWNEGRHEQHDPRVRAIYPDGIHGAIAQGLRDHGLDPVTTRTLDDPDQGLDAATLDATDVLLWWGHMAHDAVDDARVADVHARVLAGMGLIVLHSGHASKIFRHLLGTTCALRWREAGERERLWTVAPAHPIAAGVPTTFALDEAEMYGEPFDVPQPDALVFLSWFAGGNVFRSGLCYQRGRGRLFYFRPGHETHDIYFHPIIRRILANAVRWAAPVAADPDGDALWPYADGASVHEPEPLER
ncbi:MAG: ThuA domain-containing protein [Acidobacteriota bacterium]